MSILLIIYILNYIDRNNASAARLKGFEADLGLKGREFDTLLSIVRSLVHTEKHEGSKRNNQLTSRYLGPLAALRRLHLDASTIEYFGAVYRTSVGLPADLCRHLVRSYLTQPALQLKGKSSDQLTGNLASFLSV
jgi:hypothetical protein